MNSYTILLFYQYVALKPKEILAWQKKLCSQLGLKGRIIIAAEGINGTLGGSSQAIAEYKNQMLNHPLFAAIDFKESSSDFQCFPRLRIVIKNEIVNLGIDPALLPASKAAAYLEPEQAHAFIAQQPENLLILDCRNYVESEIGRMDGAVRPEIAHFRDFPSYVDENIALFKDKQVLMYCTGGVRCERASAYIQSKEVTKNVFHIKGGIHRYIEQFPNGYFKGKNYVFDGRTAVKVTDDILATCRICAVACDDYTNCLRADCNRHFIGCTSCVTTYNNCCSISCYELITYHHAPKRPHPKKVYSDHEHSTASQ